MKLMGKDITPAKVMAFVGERLAARGLDSSGSAPIVEGVEPRVDPLAFNLRALEDNADATVGLPLETHRDGLSGRAVTLAKRVFRSVGQVFINEALGRQRVFNGHVRDSYAQLSAEVLRLRQRVVELEARERVEPPPAPSPLAAPAPAVAAPPPAVVAAAPEKPRPPPPPPAPPAAPKRAPQKKLTTTARVSKPPRTPAPLPSAPRARNTRRGK